MSWFDVPATQMSIFILFESVGVVIEGAFSLWVSLTFQGFFSIILLYGEDIVSYIFIRKFNLFNKDKREKYKENNERRVSIRKRGIKKKS